MGRKLGRTSGYVNNDQRISSPGLNGIAAAIGNQETRNV